jgi:PAS domain S-box-containing protein
LYERLVEISPDIIFRIRLHPAVAFEYINPAGERILGHPLAELRAADKEYLLSILAGDSERASVEDTLAGRAFHAQTLRRWQRQDGKLIWTEQHQIPIYDKSGRLVAQEGVARDVTDREDALEALRSNEERQRRILESLPDLLLRINGDGRFVEHIPTGSRQPASVFLDRSIEDVVPAEALPAVQRALSRAAAGHSDAVRCAVNIFGGERTYEFRFVAAGASEPLVFLRDVTGEVWYQGEEQRQRERALLDLEIDRSIGLRNPYQLTLRELAVLHLVSWGSSDKEIATKLGVALSTVNKHVSHILAKMQVASRTEAGVRAVHEGIVSARPAG